MYELTTIKFMLYFNQFDWLIKNKLIFFFLYVVLINSLKFKNILIIIYFI